MSDDSRTEIERLRATNHLDIVLPPFGHAFTLPTERLNMEALEWMREHCVIVTRDEWERLRGLLMAVQQGGHPYGGMAATFAEIDAALAGEKP